MARRTLESELTLCGSTYSSLTLLEECTNVAQYIYRRRVEARYTTRLVCTVFYIKGPFELLAALYDFSQGFFNGSSYIKVLELVNPRRLRLLRKDKGQQCNGSLPV